MWYEDEGTAVKHHMEIIEDVDGSRLRGGFTAPMPPPKIEVNKNPFDPVPDDPHRISEWRRFSEHMEEYIMHTTLMKYRASGTLRSSFDLADITDKSVMVWNILKYALRLWNNKGKDHDIEKIAHYACMAWSK